MQVDITSAGPDSDSGANSDRSDCAQGPSRARPRSVAGPNTPALPLTPTEAPGRITRKARQYESAILELRAQGYTLAAICRTLAAAGVHVSLSTVRREANRQNAQAAQTPQTASARSSLRPHGPAHCASSHSYPPASPTEAATATSDAASLITVQPDPPSAKDEAEAFVRTQTTNPLVRAKEQS